MTFPPAFTLAAVFFMFASGVAQAQASDPYATLRAGYDRGDAAMAADAYTADGHYIETSPGAPSVERRGRAAMTKSFSEMFKSWGPRSPTQPIDLNFRLVDRREAAGVRRDNGFYRLRIGRVGAPDTVTAYGRFETEIVGGRFRRDLSAPATIEDFEGVRGPVMFAGDDEELDAKFYDRMSGVYVDDKGCALVVTRSVRRLFALDECTRAWRGLNRLSGADWSAPQSTVIASEGAVPFRFEPGVDRVRIGADRVARRVGELTREHVTFGSGGLTLAGTIIRPARTAARTPGVVLIHGSGPQDRHGYASIIELMAVQFARAGVTALIYDKRGVGGSQGAWANAGFSELGADARAASDFLATREGVDPSKVGFAGSSQAGWVAAKAIQDGATPAFVMLLGAAGAGSTVREQNLYNTRVRMTCDGIAAADVDLALRQQSAFFDARKDSAHEAALVRISAAAAQRPAIADWLFPATARRTAAPEWYDVLDPDFDPTPVWRNYAGRSLFVFSSFDDSTETARVVARVPRTPRISVKTLEGAQHLGLEARSLCAADLDDVNVFHPGLWPAVRAWAAGLSG